MKLVEFIAYWRGDYTEEDKVLYKCTMGDDESAWPESNSHTLIGIDIEKVIAFNPAGNKERIRVDLCGGNSVLLAISYDDFKDVLKINGIEVQTTHNSTHAISSIIK